MNAESEALVLGACRNVLYNAEAPFGADVLSQDTLDEVMVSPV
jgi:hypothetical protein